VTFDQYAPYGPVVESTVRIVTWNVRGRFGDWEKRQAAIEEVLRVEEPDIVCLVEAWSAGDANQSQVLGERLGMEHHVFAGTWEQDGWVSGVGVISRWPLGSTQTRELGVDGQPPSGEAVFLPVEGERGTIQLFVVMLDYPLDGSATRQSQVRQLATFVREASRRRHPTVLCGDFNAGPDSDEIRMLTGKAATPAPGLVFYDAWEVAGDGSPGYTWSNLNPLAAVAMYPNRRFDYVLSAWPRLGAVGHPTRCELLGVVPPEQPQLSDHYGVLAELRY
jgi:endonuclease/exonuclease/phosphatase family metal-dependent hydrolase